MLYMPKGIDRSLTKHNSKFEVFCDWLEASVLFMEDEISQNNVIDFLTEQEIYNDQDFCYQQVSSAWGELRRRLTWINTGSPITFDGKRLIRNRAWNDVPAHSFYLILSLAPYYQGWLEEFGRDYTEQGDIFELLTSESMKRIFKGWNFFITGWSKNRASKLSDVAHILAKELGEELGDFHLWASKKAHEFGLDLTWYMPFPDARGGLPIYLVQCASGDNWYTKLHTPEINLWKNIIRFRYTPHKAFALPFALQDSEFIDRCLRIDGLLLDRYRLLLPSASDPDWIEEPLKSRVVDWCKPRVEWLLELSQGLSVV